MIDGAQSVPLVLGTAAFLASAGLSGLVRRYALARSLLDVPNERSSHSVPTPRGGGLAIALVVLAGLVLLATAGQVAPRTAVALGGGGALVAAVGWLDDRRRGLPASVRLMAHAAAAVWTIAWLRGMPHLTVGAGAVSLGFGGALLAVLGIVWLTNLYNFMDGIDGLASGEAVTVGVLGALLLAPREPSLALVALLLAAAAAGFLVWNWAPARLFMGDVGSGFIGFLFGGLALASENAHALPAVLWLILLGPFFMDATITLLRRIARGERWYAGHRTHAYQRAVLGGWSHRRVTATVAALSAALGLLGSLVTRNPALLGPLLAAAAGGLGVLYLAIERWHPMPSRGGGDERGEERPGGELAHTPRSSRPNGTEGRHRGG
jgi:Fuc2NAc and GlcNAc transferase